jgi:hypothetical protein
VRYGIRVYTEKVAITKGVHVKVNQTRRHQLSGCINHRGIGWFRDGIADLADMTFLQENVSLNKRAFIGQKDVTPLNQNTLSHHLPL